MGLRLPPDAGRLLRFYADACRYLAEGPAPIARTATFARPRR
jgi:hypothetical protein